jgi:hypothetical protein
MSNADDTEDRVAAGGRLSEALRRRTVWLTDQRRDLTGAPNEAAALVAVLGREHYVERRRRYPIHSRRDLEAVLRQELAQAPPTLTLIGEPDQEKREVTFFELRPGTLERLGRAIWLVPESAALARTLPRGRVASVERDGYRYFLSANGASQPAGGTVATAELFALAAGLDSGEAPLALERADLAARLSQGLRSLPADAWLRLRLPSARRRAPFEWRRIATVAGIALASYLALGSGYLMLTRESREARLEELGPEVDSLLAAQRELDLLAARRAGLEKVLEGRSNTYELWRVVGLAWTNGARLSAIELEDFELTLRGSAPTATDVLAALDQSPGVEGARFSAPVRGGKGGLEDFAITLTLAREADSG